MSRKLPVAVAALTVALLTACGSGDGKPPQARPARCLAAVTAARAPEPDDALIRSVARGLTHRLDAGCG